MKKKIGLFIFYSFLINCCFSQSTDIVRVEYTLIPENSSGIRKSRYRFLGNAPIKLKEGNYFVAGIEYNSIDYDVNKTFSFDNSELKNLHIIDLNIGYVLKMESDWYAIGIVTPRWASNFSIGVEDEDFRLNYTVALFKNKKELEKPYSLLLGLTYNSATGLPIPLPLVSYQKRFHKNWSYAVGIPKTDIKYHFKNSNTIKAGVLLDGYFVNIQNNVVLPDNDFGSAVSLTAIVAAIGYQYNFTKYISFYGFVGRTLSQKSVLRNLERKTAFVLNDDRNIYFRTGLKIGL